jgi:DNA-binding MarR family transcriptional regulator
MVGITEEGRRRHREVAARRALVMERILSAFTPADRQALADLLDRFVDALDDVVDSLE